MNSIWTVQKCELEHNGNHFARELKGNAPKIKLLT